MLSLVRTKLLFVALFAFPLLYAQTSHAVLFRSAYVSFELPPNWSCNLEGTEWVCISQYAGKSKEAIIILTAKEVGPTDSFQTYLAHLKTPKTIPGADGKPQVSKVYQVSQRQIQNHPWIDGWHLGSEISTFYTRYLATIKERIAILVTFSAHKTHYTKYSNDFNKAIQSLRVVASKDLLDHRPSVAVRGSAETLAGSVEGIMPTEMNADQFPEEDNSIFSGKTPTYLGLLLLTAALAAYFYFKMNGGKKRKKSKSSSNGGSSSGSSGGPPRPPKKPQ